MNKEKIRLRYSQLRHNNTMLQCCAILKEELNLYALTLGDINAIGRTITPERARQLIGDRVCPRCGKHSNLVVEPLGEDGNGKLSRAFDIYCTTKIKGDKWVDDRVCLYHFKGVR